MVESNCSPILHTSIQDFSLTRVSRTESQENIIHRPVPGSEVGAKYRSTVVTLASYPLQLHMQSESLNFLVTS